MKLLIVGAGSIGERHARAFRQWDVPVALVDPRVERAREIASRYGCLSGYKSLQEAPLERFDAAVIATPADTHTTIARECARAGLHLLVEKPLATALRGTAELIAECRQRKLILAVAYVLRFHPVLERVRQICREGVPGRLLSLHAVCHHYLPWSRPDYRQTYYASATGGGGVVLDLSHEANYVEWLLGPLRFSSGMLRTVRELEMAGEAIASLSLISEVGVPVQIHLNAANRQIRRQCHIAGSRASLAADLLTGEIFLYDSPGRKERLEYSCERDAWHRAQAKDFLDAIADGAKPRCTGEDGLQTLRLCLEAMAGCTSDGSQD
jgi:predicted dehydrogenase